MATKDDVWLHHVVPTQHHVEGGDEDLACVMGVHVVGEQAGQAEGNPLMSGNW